MRIVLREDVPHVGRRGEVVKVADGYARNYLIPKRLAYLFTDGVERQVETELRARTAREQREKVEAGALADRLRGLDVLRFFRRVGETGSLYGSVTSPDIAEALGERGLEIDRRQIRLDEPIKRPGTFRVPVHLHREVEVEIVVEVEPEEAAPAT
ncbi:MAG: 50S ribosomal protein L9 [Acidobacteria bacterium]|nr:50S ribosomal protein L9 [Acidobacteriota bacterium]